MAAQALDAADGVMDGRHFGRPIIQAGGPQFGQQFGGFAQPGFGTQFAQPVQSFGTVQSFGATQFPTQFIGGQQFGGQQFIGGQQFGGAAAALDAADGVIDGRFHGRPIVQAGAVQAPVQFGGASYIQRPPIVGAPVFGGQQFIGGQQFGATQFVGGPQFGQQSTAQALDAADGVIDGRFHGRPIVQAGSQFGGTQFGGFPQQIGGFPQQFGGTQFGGFPQQIGGFPQQFGGQSRAAQLDAADGVIDGRFHGRPIVQRR